MRKADRQSLSTYLPPPLILVRSTDSSAGYRRSGRLRVLAFPAPMETDRGRDGLGPTVGFGAGTKSSAALGSHVGSADPMRPGVWRRRKPMGVAGALNPHALQASGSGSREGSGLQDHGDLLPVEFVSRREGRRCVKRWDICVMGANWAVNWWRCGASVLHSSCKPLRPLGSLFFSQHPDAGYPSAGHCKTSDGQWVGACKNGNG